MKLLPVQFMYLILFLVYNVLLLLLLLLSFSNIQRQILEVLYSSFHLKIPQWTDDYRIAIASVGKMPFN